MFLEKRQQKFARGSCKSIARSRSEISSKPTLRSLIVSHANKISAGTELISPFRHARIHNRSNRRVKSIVVLDQARRRRWNIWHGHGLDEMRWRWLLRYVYVAVFVSRTVRKVLANSLRDLAEVEEAISDVDQLWRSVGTKARNLDAAAFVRD